LKHPSLSYVLTEREQTEHHQELVVREAGIEPARHCCLPIPPLAHAAQCSGKVA